MGNRIDFDGKIDRLVAAIEGDARISAAYILGSVARKEARQDSDIDIAILPSPGVTLSALDHLQLNADIGESVTLPVDIGILSSQNVIYAKEAILRGKCIVVKDRTYRDIFAATALGLYVALRDERMEIEHAYTA